MRGSRGGTSNKVGERPAYFAQPRLWVRRMAARCVGVGDATSVPNTVARSVQSLLEYQPWTSFRLALRSCRGCRSQYPKALGLLTEKGRKWDIEPMIQPNQTAGDSDVCTRLLDIPVNRVLAPLTEFFVGFGKTTRADEGCACLCRSERAGVRTCVDLVLRSID